MVIKKNIKNLLINKKEYLLLIISFLLFSYISMWLLIVKYLFFLKNNFLLGFTIGYIFVFLGYILTILSAKWMLMYRSLRIYIMMYIFKFCVYSIPIFIFSVFPNKINIYTCIFGFSIIWISELLLLFLNDNKIERFKIKNVVKL